MAYLLDTNIVSDLVRNPTGRAARRLNSLARERVVTSVIVLAELRYGETKSASRRLSRQLDRVLNVLIVEPFDSPADVHYGLIRARLEAAGLVIGWNDMLIAAHALALDCILVTDNAREFSRISELKVENWLV